MNKEFKLKDLFYKRTIKGCPKKEENLAPNNNGYFMYGQNIKRQYQYKILLNNKYLNVVDKEYPILGYTSSVGEIGIIDESFYRSGDNGAFQGLYPLKHKFTRKELQYILTCLKKYFNEFGYSTSMNNIMDIVLSLPVIEHLDPNHEYTIDDIDFDYMEKYIDNLEQEKKLKLDEYLTRIGLSDFELTEDDKDVLNKNRITKEYQIIELFDIFHGKRLTKIDRIKGNIPLITAGEQNQGIAEYIGNDCDIYENVITIDMFGNSFYHDYKCTGDDNIYFFVSNKISNNAKKYITSICNKVLTQKFSYAKQFRQPDAESIVLSLPVIEHLDPNHEYTIDDIDFDYMEKYILALEKQSIARLYNGGFLTKNEE